MIGTQTPEKATINYESLLSALMDRRKLADSCIDSILKLAYDNRPD